MQVIRELEQGGSPKPSRDDLNQHRLQEVLEYFPDSGLFVWRAPTKFHPRMLHKTAGGISSGYVMIRVDGHKYKAHRLAWLYVNGEWPPSDVDHINGCPLDNRICNLRLATNAQNQANKTRALGKDLPKGVRKLPSGLFQSRICADGVAISLGSYRGQEEAALAYAYAARHHYKQFSRSA